MLTYEVNLRVDAAAAEAYATWLHLHIEELLGEPGFVSAEWWRVEEPSAPEGSVQWTIHYRVETAEALQNYFDGPASRFRADGLKRFGGRFDASRRVLHRRSAHPTK